QTEQIQSFNIGFTNDVALANVKAIVWTVPHDRPQNFLVANRQKDPTLETNDDSSQRTPPVSLLAVGIPVQYQISDLLAWVYNNEGASDLLQDIADRAVTRYLAGADMEEVLSHGRLEAAEILRKQIQSDADAFKLGIQIKFVGLQDIHPPVQVAPDYEKVVSTTQSKQAKILQAQAGAIFLLAVADANAVQIHQEAESYRQRLEVNSAAQAALFTNQIPAFEASPQFYAERKYFQTFSRGTAHARKYVMLTTNTQDVLIFDFQDKLSADFLDMSVTPKK
ncbi:MAG TPA: SPFH domain-containing protein, partial [Verrucomicrobiae bacterium]|nr:SPFH domain-containing protein [Verrucomicrobiae bacterium]